MLKHVLPLAYSVRPSAVYDLLRRRFGKMIPLNRVLRIEIVSIGDGVAQARLPFRREVTNHLGSVHATAIFGLAEAASGAAMAGAFAPVILSIRPVAATANVSFLSIARTDLVADAKVPEPAQDLRAKLAESGRVLFDVAVDVRSTTGATVAQMTVAWHVAAKRKLKAPSPAQPISP